MVAAVLYSENVWEIVVVTLLDEIMTCAMQNIVRDYNKDAYSIQANPTRKKLT